METTTFNGLNLLDGTNPLITLQAGLGTDAVLSIETLQRLVSTVFETTNNPTQQVISGTTFGQGDGSPNVGNLSRDMNMFVFDYDSDGYDDLLTVGLQSAGPNMNYAVTLFQGGAGGLTEVAEMSDFVEYGGGLFNFSQAFVSFSGNTLSIGVGDGSDYNLDQFTVPANGVLPNSVATQIGIGPIPFPDVTPVPTVSGDFNNDGVNDSATFSTGVLGANLKSITVDLSNLVTTSSEQSGYESLSLTSFDLLTRENALLALDSLASMFQILAGARGRIGVSLSRVGTASQVLTDTREQLAAAESRIIDTDIGSDSSELVRQNILQRAGAAILAQANLQPQIALTLLQVV